MGKLATLLVPLLLSRFPDRLTVDANSEPFARFRPLWDEFGPLQLFEIGDEVIVQFGNFTHIHCADVDETDDGRQIQATADQVIGYLEDTFNGRLRFFSNRWGGGSCPVEAPVGWFERRQGTKRGTWHGAI